MWAPKNWVFQCVKIKFSCQNLQKFFAQIDIKLYNFLIAHEARNFFSFLCRISLQNWKKGSLSVDWRKKWSLGVGLV